MFKSSSLVLDIYKTKTKTISEGSFYNENTTN